MRVQDNKRKIYSSKKRPHTAYKGTSMKRNIERHQEDKRATMILKRLLEGNCQYAKKSHTLYECLKQKQTPEVSLLTCSDSRVPPDLFNIQCLNHIFTIRNIGNQVINAEGSVKYPILHLDTPLLIILGHTGCGAIKAALSDYRKDDEAIQKEVIGLLKAITLANQTTNVQQINDENRRLAIYAQINVDYQINELMSYCRIKDKILSEQLSIVGMMFDIHGIYGKEESRVHLTNINGKIDVESIRKQKITKEIGEAVEDIFKRL